MDAKLIYSYLLSLAVCLVASCAADTGGDAVNRGAELAFEASELSRVCTTTDLDKFTVYGDMKVTDKTLTVVFDKTEVVRDPDNGQWRYAGPTQYWFPRHTHSFVAITPMSAFEAGSEPRYSNSALSFTCTLPDDFESAHDLMVATHRRMYKDNRTSSSLPVRFGFFHILSRIDFQVKNDKAADILRVTRIKLKEINRTGTFSVVPAPLSAGSEQTDDYDASWTGISNKGTLTANILVDVPENGSRSLFPDDNALFMIPQPDNKEIIMEITYELWDDGVKFEEHALTATTPIGGWEWGKMYTYALGIEEITREIYVTVSVKDWQSGTPSGIKVPEY